MANLELYGESRFYGECPYELLHGRIPKSSLSLLLPKSKCKNSERLKPSVFGVGSCVYALYLTLVHAFKQGLLIITKLKNVEEMLCFFVKHI